MGCTPPILQTPKFNIATNKMSYFGESLQYVYNDDSIVCLSFISGNRHVLVPVSELTTVTLIKELSPFNAPCS